MLSRRELDCEHSPLGEPMLARVNVTVLMPTYDDAESLGRTLESLRSVAKEAGGVRVVLVDDGSRVHVGPSDLPEPGPYYSMILVRHALNLGQGAALETARQIALREPACSAYVTMDADGQHCAHDALALARPGDALADLAFGNRFGGVSNVPLARAALLAPPGSSSARSRACPFPTPTTACAASVVARSKRSPFARTAWRTRPRSSSASATPVRSSSSRSPSRSATRQRA